MSDWHHNARHDLINHIPEGTRTVLDVGCHTGATLDALREKGYLATGMDIQDNRIDKNCKFIQGDLGEAMLAAAYKGTMFDCVIAGDTIEHVANTQQGLMNLYDALRRGGTLILSVPNIGWIENALKILNQEFPREENGPFDGTHLRWFTRKTIVEHIENAGFRNLRTFAVYLTDGCPKYPEGAPFAEVRFGEVTFHKITPQHFAELFAYQWIVVAEKPL